MVSAPPKEQVLEFIKRYGPIIPLQIKKALGGELLFIGAVLSQLSSSGKIRVTHLKYGGTPFYYVDGQERRLELLIKYLNEKDQRTALLLKQKKVLKDTELTPLQRVSIRQLKDFAIPLSIEINGNEHLFWRWFLTPEEEAITIIKQLLGLEKREETNNETNNELLRNEELRQEQEVIQKQENKAQEIEEKKEDKRREKGIEKEQREFIDRKKEKPKRKRITKEEFIKKIKQVLESRNAKIIEIIELKPNNCDLIVELSTSMGEAKYFCRAKQKKNITDGDLSSAFISAQSKKLPLLFLAFGSITKKAKDLSRREFPGAIIVEL